MARHWIDDLSDRVAEELITRGKDVYVFNGGLSISGLQHIGRLRGEIIIGEVLRKILSERGFKIKQYITLYVMDEWKGKETQLRVFKNPDEAVKYTGYPLFKIPDPYDCHKSWIEHFWEDFGPFINEFTDGEIEPVYTSELYRGIMREFVKKTFELRSKVIETLNKYRGVKLESDYIPFHPICDKCSRINSTESIEIIDQDKVRYRCKYCGYEGVTDISNGKLAWRIEWVGVWWCLGVDFEPYGKDHATPGGSRDSCVSLALNVYGFKPPIGLSFEWIALKTSDGVKDMGSSDFIGITPREWLEIAHPHVFRFIVLKTHPMKKIVIDPAEIPQYYNQYFKAERVYYGIEKIVDEDERVILSRSYELSYPRGKPPIEPPEQVSYIHLAILSQIIPREIWSSEGIRRLKMSGNIPDKPSDYGLKRIIEMIEKANKWVYKYGSDDLRIKLLPEPTREIIESIPLNHIDILKKIGNELEKLSDWREESIKQVLINSTSSLDPVERSEFYKSFYKIFLGKTSGPRAAPLLAILGREDSLKYFRKL
ncbi:MAG: lysine--tRNA ligase [Desulfurococcaceae archaeon]